MKILFLHGWQSTPGGIKPTWLKDHGHEVLNPALPEDDFDAAVRIAQATLDAHHPDVVVGSSRGGAVAMNIKATVPLVLLCPAWKRWGTATMVKLGTVVLHSPADETIPFADSQELLRTSGLPPSALVVTGHEHRLADAESLAKMLEACENAHNASPLVDVTVFYLEMTARPQRSAPAARDGVVVLRVRKPSVPYYRFLYDSVGRDYHWLGRRVLTDEALAAILGDPRNELYVLHVDGSPAGFAELDRRQPGEVELVQFGLIDAFFGQGLGSWFLEWTIDHAWSYQPQRLWLHTCTLDHPAAVPLYTKAGFTLCKQEQIRRPL